MAVLLGLDLGTQSVKAVLADSDGAILASAGREYPVEMPAPGWACQEPERWWEAVCAALAELKDSHADAFGAVSAIGLTGQMHGMVLLGADLCPVTEAIIWMDGRSAAQVEQIERCLPEKELEEHLQNRVFPGFALPSLLWVRENRPVEYGRACHVCSPKDYIRLRLTGQLGCERTDASATGAFDIPAGGWYATLLDALALDRGMFPSLADPCSLAGEVAPGAADETGLAGGTPVAYGCADECALLLGNGACQAGTIVVNIGTGATVSAWSPEDRHDPRLRTHTFLAAPDGYAVYGAILGGGINMRWLRDDILHMRSYNEMTEAAASSPPGSNGLLFLPYTAGERTPHMDPRATGMFFGARLDQSRGDLIHSVMEGVAFALRDCLEILKEMGLPAEQIVASGGGARSHVWRQALADILGAPLRVSAHAEQAGLGACMTAGMATGAFASAAEAAEALVRLEPGQTEPNPDTSGLYSDLHHLFRELYRHTRGLMHRARQAMG